MCVARRADALPGDAVGVEHTHIPPPSCPLDPAVQRKYCCATIIDERFSNRSFDRCSTSQAALGALGGQRLGDLRDSCVQCTFSALESSQFPVDAARLETRVERRGGVYVRGV